MLNVLPPPHSIVTVVIDCYTQKSILTSGESVPLGNQNILVCQVVGLPYGTLFSYTWACPNGPCEVEGYYGRKVYNEHILAVNTTRTRDGWAYTCQVTATEGQAANGSITLTVTGMYARVLYCTANCKLIQVLYLSFTPVQVAMLCTAMEDSYLIYQFPITHSHQISYLIKDGLYMATESPAMSAGHHHLHFTQ